MGAAIGAQIGVTAVKYIRGYGIRLLFAIMIIMAGVSVVLKQMSTSSKDIWNVLAAWVVMGSALGMCVIIMVRLWLGFMREKAARKKEEREASQAAGTANVGAVTPAPAPAPAKEA
jgi:hypothetical protein